MATTTNYSWVTPDDTDYVKDGAQAIRTLGSSVDTTLYTALGGTYPGLRLVKKQTIGAGVSSVTVTNAFSATYENYKIIISGGASSSTNAALALAIGAANTGYYYLLRYDGYSALASYATVKGSNTSVFNYVGNGTANGLSAVIEVQSPFLAKNTSFSNAYFSTENGGSNSGFLNNTDSYTSFSISVAPGTITGGTIYVYGYGIS